MKPIHASAGGGVPLDLERFLPFRLSVLANRVTRAVARITAQRFHMSAPEWRTMAVLGRYGAMTANNVVERTAMDKVRVSRAVARLLAAGRISRRADLEDRRRAVLDLTASGRLVYERAAPLVLAVEDDLLSGLGPEERGQFDAFLRRIEQRAAHHVAAEGEEEEA